MGFVRDPPWKKFLETWTFNDFANAKMLAIALNGDYSDNEGQLAIDKFGSLPV